MHQISNPIIKYFAEFLAESYKLDGALNVYMIKISKLISMIYSVSICPHSITSSLLEDKC